MKIIAFSSKVKLFLNSSLHIKLLVDWWIMIMDGGKNWLEDDGKTDKIFSFGLVGVSNEKESQRRRG